MSSGGFDFVKDTALLRGVRENHGGGIFDGFGVIRDDELRRLETAAFKVAQQTFCSFLGFGFEDDKTKDFPVTFLIHAQGPEDTPLLEIGFFDIHNHAVDEKIRPGFDDGTVKPGLEVILKSMCETLEEAPGETAMVKGLNDLLGTGT